MSSTAVYSTPSAFTYSFIYIIAPWSQFDAHLYASGKLQNMSKHCGAEERMLAGECDEERVRRRFSAREPCLSSQRWNVRSSYEHASHEVHTPTRWPEQAEQMTCMGVISQKLSIVG